MPRLALQKLRALFHHENGAISIMGIFMAMLLVAFVYFIMGVGETISYREHIGDAADATAWSTAVVHARGMNIIVLINMIMAAIAAVLIALKIILLMLQVGVVIADILCAIPYTAAIGCAASSALSDAKSTVKQVHDQVKSFADQVLPILKDAADGVKWAVPAVAFAKAITVAKQNYGMKFGGFYSSTLDGGLPVDDDACDKIETEGENDIGNLVAGSFSSGATKAIFDKIAQAVGNVSMMAYGSVCGDHSGNSSQTVDLSGQVNTVMDLGGCNGSDPPSWCSDVNVDSASNIQVDATSSEGGNSSDKSPKKVKDKCYLGDSCFQINAGVIGDPPIDQTRKGVAVAMWGRSDNSQESVMKALAKFGLAQSEFYFDDQNADQERSEWMWHMYWRARMRRFRFGDGSMATQIFSGSDDGGNGFSGFTDLIQNAMVH